MCAIVSKLEDCLKGLRWHGVAEWVLLAAMLVVIPISYHVAIWVFYLQAAYGLVRHLVVKGEGPMLWTRLDKWQKWTLGLMAGFWALYALSLLWTENTEVGMRKVGVMAPLILEALYVATARTGFFSKERVRAALNILTVCVVALFAVRLGTACYKLAFAGSRLSEVWGGHFHTITYTYTSMYLLFVWGYVFMETLRLWKGARGRGWMIAAMAVCWIWVFVENSRAGTLTMYVLVLAMGVELARKSGRWLRSLLLVALVWGVSLGVNACLPDSLQRLTNTIENEVETASGKNASEEEKDEKPKEDARKTLFKCGWAVVQRGPIYGYGVGDTEDNLVVEYEDYGYTSGVKERQNAHDQYMDALLAGGPLFLVVLLALLAVPAFGMMKQELSAGWLYMGVMALNLCFESMLYRELGLIPFVVFLGALIMMAPKQPEMAESA